MLLIKITIPPSFGFDLIKAKMATPTKQKIKSNVIPTEYLRSCSSPVTAPNNKPTNVNRGVKIRPNNPPTIPRINAVFLRFIL
jgi:hypothetical protein